jgi:hypothetical protein
LLQSPSKVLCHRSPDLSLLYVGPAYIVEKVKTYLFP